MRIRPLATMLVLSMGAGAASAQSASDETLKAACAAETKAYFNRDLSGWQSTWIHDAQVTRTIVGVQDVSETGWQNVSSMIEADFKQNPTPVPVTTSIENFTARQSGNFAWVEFDQVTASIADPSQKGQSREKRLLLKDGDTWKIASQVTIGVMPLEARLNNIGYALLGDGKTQDAIELFKSNVRLFPESWNVYDSLGEAYAAAGQKDLAIQNYEKSLQLNPKNATGKAALEKLKGK
jgi:tetratricopeptide (TPR) repeat protein